MVAKVYLSPRDVSEALAVSESSVKRWADQGLLSATRTAGGHRRIAVEEVLRFARRTSASIARPEKLGFEEAAHVPWQHLSGQALEDELYEALVAGDSAKAFGLIHGPFLGGSPLAWILDGPVSAAMHRLGTLWKHQPDGILLEHRATDICVQAVMRIRLALAPRTDAPRALGGAGPGDPYMLPTLMAATVVRDVGMVDTNLGPQTPLPVLREAACRLQPRLVWLSVSVDECAEALAPDLLKFAEDLSGLGVSLIVGGRAVEPLLRLRHPNLTAGRSMAELATFAKGLVAASGEPGGRQDD